LKIVTQSAELIHTTPNATLLIENAARICYKSEGSIGIGSAERIIKSMWKSGHHSPFEHASASFKIVCDRGVSHEFVRHRLMSFSQESTRYCNYNKKQFGSELTFIQPPDLTAKQREIWEKAMLDCEKKYKQMLLAGCAPEIARSVLTNSLKTEIFATANFRQWLYVIELRTSKAAHPQIRDVVQRINVCLRNIYPEIFCLTDEKI
jgi:thymidylate synthase (FAD)